MVSLTVSSFGIAVVMTNVLSDTFKMKLDWTDTEQEDNITWLTCASALGLMIGSVSSGAIVKIGRRRTIMLGCVIAIVGALMQLIFDFWLILAGKVIYGASAGLMLTAASLFLHETVPEEKMGKYGFAVNLGITMGLSVVLNMGLAVSNDDPDSQSWLLVGLIPVVFAALNLLLWLTCFRAEPINFCIENANRNDYKEQAYAGIRRCYLVGEDMD